jgi:flagella basal body P-ring formation protein FlgA
MNPAPRTPNPEARTGRAAPAQSSKFKVPSSKFLAFALTTLLAAPLSAQSPEPLRPSAAPAAVIELLPASQVTSAGVFLDDIATNTNAPVPHLRIAAAPKFGQAFIFTRAQISAALSRLVGGITNFSGAEQVRVTRRSRPLEEEELKLLVTAQLQHEVVKDRGELELRLNRPWAAVMVPDEPFAVRVSDLPATGLSSLFIARVELATTNETIGSWQLAFGAKLWREVWTCRTALRRGTQLADADLVRERRDVMALRDPLADFANPDPGVETAEYIAPNAPLFARSLKARPVVRRGQSAEAVVADGALMISMKVEVLEDGAPGQVVRVRNPQSRRELRGKVQNEQTILVSL